MEIDLRVLCWDHPRCTSPLSAAAREWEQRNRGTRVHVAARPLAAFNDQPLDEVARSADLLFIDHPMVGTAAGSLALLALDDLLAPDVLSGLATDSIGSSHDTYRWDGRQWATAVDAACQVAVVDAARADRMTVAVPRTWDEVLHAARVAPCEVAIPLYPTDAVLSLLSISASLRAPGEVTPGIWSLEAVRVLCELVRWVHPQCFEMNPPRLLDLMSTGPAAAAPVYAPLLFGYSNYQRPGHPGRRLRFLDAPTFGNGLSGAVLGGAGLAVSAHARHPEEAARFTAWLAGADAQRDVVLAHDGQPASRSVWDDPGADALVGGFFSGTRATIASSHVRPRDPWWPAYQDAAGVLLVQMLRRGESPTVIHDELRLLLDRTRTTEASL